MNQDSVERVGIINYGVGNLNSIKNMLNKIDVPCEIINSPDRLFRCTKYILPGVGAYDYGIKGLRNSGFVDDLGFEVNKNKKAILGICLGMQLLCEGSEEGILPGLGWINLRFKKFSFGQSSQLKVPHMGWNSVSIVRDNPLIPAEQDEQERFYFVHSYYAEQIESSIPFGITNHGGKFVAAFSKDNIFGVQFHPEKSHKFGMRLLKRFWEYKNC